MVGFWLQVQELEGFGLQGIHFGDLLNADFRGPLIQ